MYSLDDILLSLKANKNIEIELPIPVCPKHANIDCSKIAGNCPIGNDKKCEQRLQFYVGTRLINLYPKFVISENTKIGFLKENNMTLNMLFKNGVLNPPHE